MEPLLLEVRKLPTVVHAVQLSFQGAFSPGDYLVLGVNGEQNLVSKDIFEATYEIRPTESWLVT